MCVLNESESRRNFVCFQVTELPWNQDELAPETLPFVDKLAHINKHGILTINSQPNVNAAPSTDPVAGWGRPGGYVFQKVNMHDSFSYSILFIGLYFSDLLSVLFDLSRLFELVAVPNLEFIRSSCFGICFLLGVVTQPKENSTR